MSTLKKNIASMMSYSISFDALQNFYTFYLSISGENVLIKCSNKFVNSLQSYVWKNQTNELFLALQNLPN